MSEGDLSYPTGLNLGHKSWARKYVTDHSPGFEVGPGSGSSSMVSLGLKERDPQYLQCCSATAVPALPVDFFRVRREHFTQNVHADETTERL